ncbi:MAG: threonine ammonia-lyase [Desulfobacterales bacterium]|nr:threonine ammonia-lyase [Desulfobacterales bacterium]
MTVEFKDIRQAADLLAGNIIRTTSEYSQTLSQITGADVILKFENHQFTASFKERGALTCLLSLSAEQRRAGVIAMSAGNHAQGVAYHAQRLKIPATIVMPRFTPSVKVSRTRAFGAEVLLYGDALADARSYALELVKDRGLKLIHPYDDEKIIAGQGTIALEMLNDFPDIEQIVIPVGGGGLIAGNAIAAKALKPDIEIIGVQTSRFPAMVQALEGAPIQCETATFAEGIAVTQPGALTLPIVRKFVDEILLVEESQIEAAVLLLLEVEKTVVEGAGAVGLAALLAKPERFKRRKVGLVLSGGNIDLFSLSSIIQRGLVRSGRLVRLRVSVPDVPGALSEITHLLGQSNANIIEIQHQRAFTNLALRLVEVEFVLQTLGSSHIKEIMNLLSLSNYKAELAGAGPADRMTPEK